MSNYLFFSWGYTEKFKNKITFALLNLSHFGIIHFIFDNNDTS